MSGGSQTSTTQSGPPASVLAAYNSLNTAGTNLAQQPLQQYTSPMVAGFAPQQQEAMGQIQNASAVADPYINSAAQEFGTATTPLWQTLPQYSADTVNSYLSPYTSDVTNSLSNLYNSQNATQQAQLEGSAVGAGAYGGDRQAVAQALTAQQENLSQAPTLAQVQQQGFTGAQGEFNTQQAQQLSAEQANAWLASQAGFGLGGLGTEAQTTALTGANANLQSGALQQQLAQEQLNVPYQEFEQAQAYPYQQLGFLAPITEGTGSLSGGTGTTTTPGPSALSQLGGLGLTGIGAYGLANQSGLFSNPSYSDFATTAGGDSGSLLSDAGGVTGKRGGRFAAGGVTTPMIPGIGQGVPTISISDNIPTGSTGGGSPMGLSPFQPDVTQTTSSDPGLSGILGPLSAAVQIGKFFAKRGGRIGHYDTGGGIGTSATQLPAIPTIDLSWLKPPAGAQVKGSGPPHAPNPVAQTNPMSQANSLTSEMGSIGKILDKPSGSGGLGSASDTSDSGDARGGRIGGIGHAHRQDGGQGSVPVSIAAQFGGAPPNVTNQLQQLLQLPLQRLQQMAVQYPPTTQQGQMVAQALRQKQATPGSGTAAGTQPQQQGAGGLGTSAAPTGSAQPLQSAGGTSQSMAAGGDADTRGYVTADELDPHPVVDHSGDTVKIRYPSEGKVLDLGLPAIKPEERVGYAAGGAAGQFPTVGFSDGAWGVSGLPTPPSAPAPAIQGPGGNAPLLGTAQAETGGPATPFESSLPTANGVAIPQLSAGISAPPAGVSLSGPVQPGGGLGNWSAPLAQTTQFGTGPGGSTVFPSATAYTPGMGAVISGLNPGATIPQWAGGPPPGASTSTTPSVTSQQSAADAASQAQLAEDASVNENVGSGGGKRGGNVAHFDDGGAIPDDVLSDTGGLGTVSSDAGGNDIDYKALGIAPPTTDFIGLGAPRGDKQDSPGFTSSWPTAKVAGGKDIVSDIVDKASALSASDTANQAAQDKAGNPYATAFDGATKPTVRESPFTPAPTPKAAPPASPPSAAGGIGDDVSGLGLLPDEKAPSPSLVKPTISGTNLGSGIGAPSKPVDLDITPADRAALAAPIPRGGIGDNTNAPASPAAAAPVALSPAEKAYYDAAVAPGGDMSEQEYGAFLAKQRAGNAALASPMPNATQTLASMRAANQGIGAPSSSAPASGLGVVRGIGGGGNQASGTPIGDYIRQGAIARGINPDQATHTASTEGGLGNFQLGDGGSSGGPFQLHLDDPANPGKGTSMGDQFYRDTGKNPLDPANEKATVDYALDYAKAHGGTFDPNIWHGLRSGNLVTGDQAWPSRQGQAGGIGGGASSTPAGQPTDGGIGQAVAITHQAISNTPPEHRSGLAAWMHSPYYLAFLTGAGMLASTSHFPGVALGQGLETAAKGMQTQQAEDVHEKQLANEAQNRQATLGIEQKRLDQTGTYQNRELDVRQQTANQQLAAENQRFQIQMGQLNNATQREQETQRHNQTVEAITAGTRAAQIAKPMPGYERDAQGNLVLGTQQWNPLTERYDFVPGSTVGRAPVATGERAIVQDLMHSDGVTEDEAIRRVADLKAHPQSAQNAQKFASLVTARASMLQNNMQGMNLSPQQIHDQAVKLVQQDLGIANAAQPAVPAATSAQAPAPAAQKPAMVPTQQGIDLLKANPTPDMRQHFDDYFGAGAAQRALQATP